MSDVIYSLRRQNFPEVLKPALQQVEKCLTQKQEGVAGLSASEVVEQIVDEFVFQQSTRKGPPKKRLTALQELQVIEHILQYFSQKGNEVVQQQVFKALFDSATDRPRGDLLGKLISMAVGVSCSSLLNAAAVWMQLKGCSSLVVCSLVRKLVEDYFVLAGGTSNLIQNLPSLSPHFACNFITAVTAIYQPAGGSRNTITVPENLLSILCEWLSNNSRLCLTTLGLTQSYFLHPHRTNLWTSPTKPNTQTPTPGLVRWCVQAPLLQKLAIRELNNKYERSKDRECQVKLANLVKINPLWSRLHLYVLETIMQLPSVNNAAQLELLTLVDMSRSVRELNELLKMLKVEQIDSELQVAVDRLVQILQIALATGAFRCSLADLRSILDSLPASPLKPLLERQHLSTAPPQMHNAP